MSVGVWVSLKVLLESENSAPLIQVSPDTPEAGNGQTAKCALGGIHNAQQPERPGELSGRGFPAKGNMIMFYSHRQNEKKHQDCPRNPHSLLQEACGGCRSWA